MAPAIDEVLVDLSPIELMRTVPGLLPYVPVLLMVLGLCAAVMPWVPPPANPRSVYGVCYAVLNAMAQNYRNTRNAAEVCPDAAKPAHAPPPSPPSSP